MVLQVSDIEELGKYTVVIMIWQLTRYIPQVLSKAFVPYLAKNIHENNILEIINYYKYINRITVLLSTFIIMFVLIFSDSILGVFGKSFLDMNNILILLVGSSVFLTLSYTITPMMIAYEFNKIRLMNSLAQIFIQVVVTMILINYFQILGIVLGLLLSVIIAQIFPIYKIYKVLGSHVKVISVEFIKSVFLISLIIVITLINTNILIDIITFVILIVAFFFIFKISKEELYQMKKVLRGN